MWLGSFCMLLNTIYVSIFSEFLLDAKSGLHNGFSVFLQYSYTATEFWKSPDLRTAFQRC